MHAPFSSCSVAVFLFSPVGGFPVLPSSVDTRASSQFPASLLSFITVMSRSTFARYADAVSIANLVPSSSASFFSAESTTLQQAPTSTQSTIKGPVAANTSNAGVNGNSSAQALSGPGWRLIGLSGPLTKSQVMLLVIAILLGIIMVILVGIVIRWLKRAWHDVQVNANEKKITACINVCCNIYKTYFLAISLRSHYSRFLHLVTGSKDSNIFDSTPRYLGDCCICCQASLERR